MKLLRLWPLAAALVAGAGVIVAAVVFAPRAPQPQPQPQPAAVVPRPDEPTDPVRPPAATMYDPDEDANLERTVVEAWERPTTAYGPPRSPTAAEGREIGVLFAQLSAANAAIDNDRVKALFDLRRHFQESVRIRAGSRAKKLPAESWRLRWNLGVHQAINVRFVGSEPKYRWDEMVLTGPAAFSADGAEAVVSTRDTAADRPEPRVRRWRLARSAGGWRVIDFTFDHYPWLWFAAVQTDIDNGTTKITGDGGEPDLEIGTLALAVFLSAGSKPDTLEKHLATARGVPVAPELEAWRQYAEGSLRLARGKPAEAVPFLDAAVRADPTWPPPYGARAAARNRLGEHTAAAADARRMAELVGPWPEAAIEEATALRALGREDDADAILRVARTTFPNDRRLKPVETAPPTWPR